MNKTVFLVSDCSFLVDSNGLDFRLDLFVYIGPCILRPRSHTHSLQQFSVEHLKVSTSRVMYLWKTDLVLPLKPRYVLFCAAQVNSSLLLIF